MLKYKMDEHLLRRQGARAPDEAAMAIYEENERRSKDPANYIFWGNLSDGQERIMGYPKG